jgi:hypothetical protein
LKYFIPGEKTGKDNFEYKPAKLNLLFLSSSRIFFTLYLMKKKTDWVAERK